MFDFLEELAAFYGYVNNNQYLKCKTCGLLVEKHEATKTNQMVECPKCGDKEWEESSLLEQEEI
jgi:Zn finger protein HypA/HybF involved in hydrogenase expression